jgi:hypothetical protein
MMGQQADRKLAHIQFEALVRCYQEIGLRVDIIEQDPNLPDMVFTANAGLIYDKTFIPSNFPLSRTSPRSCHICRPLQTRWLERGIAEQRVCI